jgi:hypothetical protein
MVQRTLNGIFIGYFAAATAGALGGPGEIERLRRRYGR